jgi:flagellin
MNASSRVLQKTQNEISTGLKVSSAADNGATWTVAQNMRSQVSAWQTVTDSLNRGQSIVDVAVSAAQSISDLLNQVKAKALAYSDPSNDAASLAAYKSDIQSLVGEIDNVAHTSDFNGINLINKNIGSGIVSLTDMYASPTIYGGIPDGVSGTINLSVSDPSAQGFETVSNPSSAQIYNDGSQSINSTVSLHIPAGSGAFVGIVNYTGSLTITSGTFTPDGFVQKVGVNSDLFGGKFNLGQFDLTSSGLSLNAFDWNNPIGIISAVNTAVATVNSATAQLGTQSSMLSTSISLAKATQDTFLTGIGNLVDADVAKDSAKLTAEQTKQQLATQSLSIENNAPSILLLLFK